MPAKRSLFLAMGLALRSQGAHAATTGRDDAPPADNAGDKAQAIRNYQTSLDMNPGNDNARQQLEKLRR